MSKNKKKNDGMRLRAGRTSADLGRLVAEEDANLDQYYVRKDRYVDRAMNLHDQASFFVGPKGAGKSAILQMLRLDLKTEAHRIINLSPKQLAFSAFSNIGLPSSLLIDANKKQWIYKSLWDYIIATEVGSREYIDDSSYWNIFSRLLRGVDEKRIRRLLRLRFDDQGNLESLSSRFLKLINEVELSGKIDVMEVGGIEGKVKFDPEALAKRGQFELLGLVHEVSSRLADTITNRYYILIDDLDVDWHNEPVQNEVIAAMFASLRKICRPPKLKCVVSIQDRIFRELPIEHKDKFRDALCHVEWEASIVKEMIERRVNHVLHVPTGKVWERMFPQKAFDFIWNRIGGKPREAIRLASICLETARKNSHGSVTQSDMDSALKTFSIERLEDIGSELCYIYPGFTAFLKHFNGYQKEFPLRKVKDAVDLCILKSHDNPQSAFTWIRGYEDNYLDIAKLLLENHILQFKKGRSDPAQPYDAADHDITSDAAFVSFHPMYAAGLGLAGGI